MKKTRVIIASTLMALTLVGTTFAAGVGYKNYADLAKHETLNKDYAISFNDCGSSTTILATHGGKIQTGTSEIASAIATGGENRYNLYTFNGTKSSNNLNLFLKNTIFTEPQALKLVKKSTNVITIIGTADANGDITLSGQNGMLEAFVLEALWINKPVAATNLVDKVMNPDNPDVVNGSSVYNITNKGINPMTVSSFSSLFQGGVQIGFSSDLRKTLTSDPITMAKLTDSVTIGVKGYDNSVAQILKRFGSAKMFTATMKTSKSFDFNALYKKILSGKFDTMEKLSKYIDNNLK